MLLSMFVVMVLICLAIPSIFSWALTHGF
jgi:hypothetical protein